MREFNSRIYGMIISCVKSIYYRKWNGRKGGLKPYIGRVERYREYIRNLQCPVCGRRFTTFQNFMNHLWNSRCKYGLYNEVVNGHHQRYIYDEVRGEIIDPVNGEVIEDRIMVYEHFDERNRMWKLLPVI